MSVVASCEWSVPVSSAVHSSDKSEVPMRSGRLNLTYDPPVPRPWAGMEGSSKERVCQAQYPPLLGVVSGVILGRFQGVSLHLLYTHTHTHTLPSISFSIFPIQWVPKQKSPGMLEMPLVTHGTSTPVSEMELEPNLLKTSIYKNVCASHSDLQGNPGDSFSICHWLVPSAPSLLWDDSSPKGIALPLG